MGAGKSEKRIGPIWISEVQNINKQQRQREWWKREVKGVSGRGRRKSLESKKHKKKEREPSKDQGQKDWVQRGGDSRGRAGGGVRKRE